MTATVLWWQAAQLQTSIKVTRHAEQVQVASVHFVFVCVYVCILW